MSQSHKVICLQYNETTCVLITGFRENIIQKKTKTIKVLFIHVTFQNDNDDVEQTQQLKCYITQDIDKLKGLLTEISLPV